MVSFYTLISFFILYQVGDMLKSRYFLHIAFVSILFVGFFVQYLQDTFARKGRILAVCLMVLLVAINGVSLIRWGVVYSRGEASEERNPIYGETRDIATYIMEDAFPHKRIYISGNNVFRFTFGGVLAYFGERNRYDIEKVDLKKISGSLDRPAYWITEKDDGYAEEKTKVGREIVSFRVFGNIVVYRLSESDEEKDENSL
jgi:hypothetical protein